MRYLVLALLGAWMPWPATAACPGHQASITATTLGTLRVCPSDLDADGVPVPSTGYYSSCEVTAVWAGGGTATATVTTPTPGTPYVVGFPAARGAGGATARCSTISGLVSPIASASVTFRAGGPVPPALGAVPSPPVP